MPNPHRNICPGCKRFGTTRNKTDLCERCVLAANTPAQCAECGGVCRKATVAEVYPDQHHLPQFANAVNKVYWLCDCGAYVGSHEGSGAPLGTAAGFELRALRTQVHTYFDKLWRHFVNNEGWQKHMARASLYGWLAGRLGIFPDKCHIAMFDAATCRRAIEACQAYHFPTHPLSSN